MKKFFVILLTIIMACCSLSLTACNNKNSGQVSNKNSDILAIYNLYVANVESTGGTPASYEEWLASIKGEKGEPGEAGVSIVKIVKTATNGLVDTYTITYSNGKTDTFTVTNGKDGEQGSTGTAGNNGVSPKLQINTTTNEWEVSYDDGETWTSLGVKATGEKGQTGEQGSTGNNGISPKLQINTTTNEWEVSYDDGKTWTSLGVKATGEKGQTGEQGSAGKDAITYVPVIFNNYDGTKLYEFYYEYGTDIVYDGPTPTRDADVSGENVTSYTFNGWDKSLTNITKPTIFTAQYNVSTFVGYKVTFNDSDDNLLYENYYAKGANVVYPYTQPFSYDDTNVYQFVGWSSSTYNLQSDITVKPIIKTIPRSECAEYPQSVVTDDTIITELDKISETDDNGYKTYNNVKYYSFTSASYEADDGTIISAGSHYYKVEPIQWRWLESSTNSYKMVSNYIIDWQPYSDYYIGTRERTDYKNETATVYANNYKYSNIRTWLNTTFLNRAFSSSSVLMETSLDNGGDTNTDVSSEATYDKVFLLSADEMKSVYYFDSTDFARDCKGQTTEFARAGWSNIEREDYRSDLENSYLTRSAYSGGTHAVDYYKNGKVAKNYNVGFAKGVRPAINLIIND